MDKCDVYIVLADWRKWEKRPIKIVTSVIYLDKFSALFLLQKWIQEIQILLEFQNRNNIPD